MSNVSNPVMMWRGLKQLTLEGRVVEAFVSPKDYGADVELSDGRTCSLWAYAVPGDVVEAAVNWAQKNGAALVTVRA